MAGFQLQIPDLGGDLQDLRLGGRGAGVEVSERLASVGAELLGACAELLGGPVVRNVRRGELVEEFIFVNDLALQSVELSLDHLEGGLDGPPVSRDAADECTRELESALRLSHA